VSENRSRKTCRFYDRDPGGSRRTFVALLLHRYRVFQAPRIGFGFIGSAGSPHALLPPALGGKNLQGPGMARFTLV
jgi:hypothetical protein